MHMGYSQTNTTERPNRENPLKIARTTTVALALTVGATIAGCASTAPPEGCPDTAPNNIKGKVIGKQKDTTAPTLVASNGAECWHLHVSNTGMPGTILSVYVSKAAFDAVRIGDSFTREMVRSNK